MSKNSIDINLQAKAKQYIEFKLEHERAMRESDKVILQSLSQNLRDQMIKQVNGRVIKNNQLFQKSFGSSLLTKLATLLEEQLLAPDEYIYKVCIFHYVVPKSRKMNMRIIHFILYREGESKFPLKDLNLL